MTIIATLLGSIPYIGWPSFPFGWAGWLFLFGLVGYLLYRWRPYETLRDNRSRLILAGLVLLVPVTGLFVGIRLPAGSALPLPGLPLEPTGPALMLLGAFPWILAGGLLGPLSAALVGFLAGLLRGLLDTHSLFTALEFALLAACFSALVRQRYRTWLYRLLQNPLVAAACLVPLYAILFFSSSFFSATGTAASRVDYALTNLSSYVLAVGAELLIAGLFAQVIALVEPGLWGRRESLQPSPAERSLQTRFLYGMGLLISLLLLTLLVANWVVAGNAARQMLRDRLAGTAEASAETVPFFLETGQNLVVQMSRDPVMQAPPGEALTAFLGQQIRTIPFFTRVWVLDRDGTIVTGYPDASPADLALSPEETLGIELAFNGVLSQVYTVAPAEADGSAQVSFLATVLDESGQPVRILLGRTDIGLNPFTQPLINNLESMVELGGTGILLDDEGRVLYDTASSPVLSDYPGGVRDAPVFFDESAPTGTRNLVYYQPLRGRSWAIVLKVPAQRAQQLALNIALPLSAMIFLLALVALVSLRIGLGVVTESLQTLAGEALRIAQGELDHALDPGGIDEVGQLRNSFEQMRLSLRDRLNDLNRLLEVSQGVAASLQMEDAVRPVLEGALATGASMVKVVLSPSAMPEPLTDMPVRFAFGPSQARYDHLDETMLALAQDQERLVLPNVSRIRSLDLSLKQPHPPSILAVALRHENRYYGVLWLAFDQPHTFSETEVGFTTTLAGYAALAAANAHLFMRAEVGRQRLAAILNSSPDPILVTDHQNHMLLANPVARQVLELGEDSIAGQPIARLVNHKLLLEILHISSKENQSAEIELPGDRTYLAMASNVLADGLPVGRVCILRDVTHFKELDSMKSDFVATVSHDLRSPLTLMRGYATMLEMVGPLNEQQKSYVRKIIGGVENMARLINNLLDLGRIEIGVGLRVDNVRVLDILERVIGQLQLQITQKNIQVQVKTSRDLPREVEADQALLQQAVFNLIENAIKYTPNGGRVMVRVIPTLEGIRFEVEDTGIGISPVDQPHLFEKFYRGGQREARQQRGTGLGLAIVRSIAERHTGKVWLESQLGKGSIFYLEIPTVQSREEQPSRPVES